MIVESLTPSPDDAQAGIRETNIGQNRTHTLQQNVSFDLPREHEEQCKIHIDQIEHHEL